MIDSTNKRILFLDILRFLAIIDMVIIHTYNSLLNFGVLTNDVSKLTMIANIIYLVSPTIFMFAMGASINLTTNKNAKSFIIRGIKILVISIILNMIRGILLSSFSYLLCDDFTFADFIFEVIDWTVGNDILMFAGFYFIIFGIVCNIKKNKSLVLILFAIIAYVISLFIPLNIESDYYLLDSFLGNFIFIGESYFPILTWFIIPTIAFFFYQSLETAKDKDKFMNKSALIASLIFVVTLITTLLTNTFETRYLLWGEDLFYFDLPTMILTLSLNYIYITGIYYLAKFINKTTKLKKIVVYLSSNLTKIYFIHWIIVILLAGVLALTNRAVSSTSITILYGIAVLVISSLISLLFIKKSKSSVR